MPRTATSDVASALAGRAVREARTEVGLTQADLARRLDVNASYITNLEAGRVNVTIGQLAGIAEALGTGLEISLPVLSVNAD